MKIGLAVIITIVSIAFVAAIFSTRLGSERLKVAFGMILMPGSIAVAAILRVGPHDGIMFLIALLLSNLLIYAAAWMILLSIFRLVKRAC